MSVSRDPREVEQAIVRQKVVPVVRLRRGPIPLDLVQALMDGGARCLEIAMTTPRALTTLRSVRERYGEEVFLGAGSALNAEMARLAVRAGAEFIASPGLNEATIDVCRRINLLVIPGVMTPTDAMRAWHAGAQLLKLFPASVVGPRFIIEMRGPLPWVRWMPTGGITPDNIQQYFEAGAVAVGVGGWLVVEDDVEARRYSAIVARFEELVKAIGP
ncbi:MAG: bifunctional 4-hydroxy-2-oxoglutarate aldolase/2-dehydro-3-deoxy-phosphogluconate aldolase [Armatimonadetes bacterium]|nr:bifunctional 4-hydroxy-2-oxoglutarate aldolase/2-dehydro-3-deoxy-phosphogluconate aldolase [Armatimonadota bacterium]